jgi:hypothetical protein
LTEIRNRKRRRKGRKKREKGEESDGKKMGNTHLLEAGKLVLNTTEKLTEKVRKKCEKVKKWRKERCPICIY